MFYKYFLTTIMALFIVSCTTNTNDLSERAKALLDLQSDKCNCRKRGVDYFGKCGKSEGLDIEDTNILLDLIRFDPDFQIKLRAISFLEYSNQPDYVRSFYVEELSKKNIININITASNGLVYKYMIKKLLLFKDKEAIAVVEKWLSTVQYLDESMDGDIAFVKKRLDNVKIKNHSPIHPQKISDNERKKLKSKSKKSEELDVK